MQYKTVDTLVHQILQGNTSGYSQLSTEEKTLLDSVLSELRDTGKSTTLNCLWEQDFEIKPVTIDKFLEDDYYLGKIGKDIFPKWRDELRVICDPSKEVCEWVIRGCFTGDTKVKLLNGEERSLRDWADNYSDEECYVYSYDNRINKVSVGLGKKPRKTGKKIPCVKVTLDSGETEIVTPDHLFLLSNGRYKEAGFLGPGDSLMPLYTTKDAKGYEHYIEPTTKDVIPTHDMVARWKYGQYFRAVRVEDGQPNVVHHMDFNKENNSPDNLSVESRDHHLKIHADHNRHMWETRRDELSTKISKGLQNRLKDEEFRRFKAEIGTKNLQNTPERSRKKLKEYMNRATPEQLSARATKGLNTYWNDPLLGELRRKERSFMTSLRNYEGLSQYALSCYWTEERREEKRKETIEYNKYHHPRLRKDITLDVICEALLVDPGMTNKELTEMLDCSMTTVYNVCKRNNLSVKEVKSIVNHKVVSVEYAGDFDVYNIEVDDLKNYALSSGIFVHNCVGAGKTTVAVIALLHRIQVLCCMKNPQQFYGLMEGSPIVFGLFNIYKYLAQDTSYKYFTNWVKLSPFFQDAMRSAYAQERSIPGWLQRLNRMYGIDNDEMANSYMRFPKGITIALGSSAIHALGQNLYGGLCFVGDTKVPLLDGTVKTLKDLSKCKEETIWYYGVTKEGKIIPTMGTKPRLTRENSPVVKVTLDDGSSEVCTPDHLWFMSDGSCKEAQSLIPGDSLMPYYSRVNDQGYQECWDNSSAEWVKTHQMVGRFVWGENFYGYPVEDGQYNVVHHSKGKLDNRPESLKLMGHIDHFDLHTKLTDLCHTPEAHKKRKKTLETYFKNVRPKISSEISKRAWQEYKLGLRSGYDSTIERFTNKTPEEREFLSRMCISRNKTPEMRLLSGERLRQWNLRNMSLLRQRGTAHMNELWKDPCFRRERAESSSKRFTEYNKTVKRSKISFDDLVSATYDILSSKTAKNSRGQDYIFSKRHLVKHFQLKSRTVIDRILRENDFTWNEFTSVFGCKVRNHKVVSVEPAGYADTYCLSTTVGNFALRSCFVHNCDEADMSKNRALKSDEKTKVEELYGQAKSRLDSRFLQLGGLNPGLLVLVSQVQEADSFLSKHVEKVSSDIRTHVSSFSLWEIKDHLFPPTEPRFQVVVGTRSYRSFIVEQGKMIPKGAQIIDVPESLRPRFEYSVDDAIRDQAGIPTYGANLFLPRRDKLFECYQKAAYRDHPFTTEVIELSIEAEDKSSIADYFVKEACMNQYDKATGRWRPKWFPGEERAIHIDLSKNGDCTGMAMGCIGNIKRVQRYDGDGRPYWEQAYETFADFVLRIKAAKGSEIDFSKIRQFIFYLQALGYIIRYISLDGYNSVDTIQIMKKAGFDAKELSVDKKSTPYNYLKSAIYELRLDMYEYEPLTEELTKLQDKTLENGKPPIDHPTKGSKDCSDALCGITARLAEVKEELRPSMSSASIEERAKLHSNNQTQTIQQIQDPSWLGKAGNGNPLSNLFKR